MSLFNLWWWFSFIFFIFILLIIEQIFTSKNLKLNFKIALGWTCYWIFFALLFDACLWLILWQQHGLAEANEKALTFFTGFTLEKLLSIDNLFIFFMIFNSFKLAEKYQRQLLKQGVFGAIIMRCIMILGGVYLIKHFHWLFYVFGCFLILTALKMLFLKKEKSSHFQSQLIPWIKKSLPFTDELHDSQYLVKINNAYQLTPLFLILILIEISDLIFALDSIPAIFGVTTDTFIIFSSNIFAILGLRALYFVLAQTAQVFSWLSYSIAFILLLIGIKMIITPWISIPVIWGSLSILFILILSLLLNWLSLRYIKK